MADDLDDFFDDIEEVHKEAVEESKDEGKEPELEESPSKKAKIDGIATSDHSLESSVAKREAAARAKAEAEDAERAAAARREEAERQRAAAAKPVVVEDPTKPAPVKFVKSKKRAADETTRQRNKRKEGLGQAKFTLKEDRDCPSIWDGGNS